MIERTINRIRENGEAILMFFISIACIVYIYKFSDAKGMVLYWANEVGPTIYLMVPMSAVLVWIIIMLMLGRIDDLMLRMLLWLEKYSTQAGLLGSVLGLISSLHGFDFSNETTTMIQAVVSGLVKALVSTAYGLVISIIAGSAYEKVVKTHVE